MHCIAALAVLKQFWCRVIKRLRITLLCPWCYYILWWLSSIKIYKIGGSETLKQWLSSIRIIKHDTKRKMPLISHWTSVSIAIFTAFSHVLVFCQFNYICNFAVQSFTNLCQRFHTDMLSLSSFAYL